MLALHSICEIPDADTEALLLFNINYQAINRRKRLYLLQCGCVRTHKHRPAPHPQHGYPLLLQTSP